MNFRFRRIVRNAIPGVFLTAHAVVASAQATANRSDTTRDVERPNAISRLDVTQRSAGYSASTLSQLITARFPGMQVTANGATGTGARIRIRGQSSLLSGNEPLVVVDGIRLYMSPNNATTPVPSRIDDISVADIQDVEILTGAAATLQYGTGAANGVISITTKRGVRGRPHLEVNAEEGVIDDGNTYPDVWTLFGKRGTNPATVSCTLTLVANGACVADSLRHGSIMNIDSLTPIDRGSRGQYGARISGGSQWIAYSLSGQVERETGVFKMPDREVQRLEAQRSVSSLPDDQLRPSALEHNALQANIAINPTSFFSARWSSMYLDGDTRLLVSDGQSNGIGFNATGGPWRFDLKDPAGTPLVGYASYPAGDIMSQTTTQRIHRFTNSVRGELHPVSWLNGYATFGYDNITQQDKFLVLTGQGPNTTPVRAGTVTDDRAELSQRTLEVGVTAARSITTWLRSRTSVGAQWLRGLNSDSTLSGSDLPVGATSPNSGALQSGSTSASKSTTAGYFIEEVLGIHDELFFTAGVRHDELTDGVSQRSTVNYPAVGVSWLVSAHDRFRETNWLDSLRLRTSVANTGTPLSFVGLRLVQDKPEITKEFESGFDASIFHNASRVSLTVYRKSTDSFLAALVPNQPIPGLTRLVDGLTVQNTGIEASLNQTVLNGRNLSASLLAMISANKNRVTKYPANVAPQFSGDRTTQKSLKDYPLFGLWTTTYTYNDSNKDGILTASELVYSDTASFVGSSFPTREIVIAPTVEFLNHKLRLNAQFDSKGGFSKFNNTLRHQCQIALSCRGLADKSESLEDQAAALAASQGIFGGVIEDASFTRLREASVVYELPTRWATALRASSWNVALTGRNLALWTKYKGTDPEASESTTDAGNDEFFSTPPMRYFLLKFNFVF